MSGQPTARKASKVLGAFSFGLGVAQLAGPERVNELIGVRNTPRTRAIQRAIGVQELTAAQGIFAFSPPTPVLWSRVAGDLLHLGLLAKAYDARRNDQARLRVTIGSVVMLGVIDALVASRYQAAWPKEPTQGEPLPSDRGDETVESSVPGRPAITIRASESEIRARLGEFELEKHGELSFSKAPGDRGTEVLVDTTDKSDQVKSELRRLKQLIEVGEIVRSEAAPEGATAKRLLKQRPGQHLSERELEKAGRS